MQWNVSLEKWKEILTHAMTGMTPEATMLSEISQSQNTDIRIVRFHLHAAP